jgi:hypothetical protein
MDGFHQSVRQAPAAGLLPIMGAENLRRHAKKPAEKPRSSQGVQARF